MTYRDRGVLDFLETHFVAVRLRLEDKVAQASFRDYAILWTPTLAFLDRREQAHYQAPGYHSPELMQGLLRLGLARCLMAWSRAGEAARHLEWFLTQPEHPLAAEGLYWLGMAYYLPSKKHRELMRAWEVLQERYPASVWAQRVPPEEEEEKAEEKM